VKGRGGKDKRYRFEFFPKCQPDPALIWRLHTVLYSTAVLTRQMDQGKYFPTEVYRITEISEWYLSFDLFALA
jgi:hypothetical protein